MAQPGALVGNGHAHHGVGRERGEDDRPIRLCRAQLLVFRVSLWGAVGFNTETSPGPAIASLASRQKFLPDADAWPPTANWSFHNGGGEFANLKVLDEAMMDAYAKPASAADYERMAQTMAYDSERAMFEAYGKNKYFSTGVIQWMLNNAWPSMIWHLYDYYLDAGAGYFATRKACEPLHIQYSYDDRSIVVVNSTYQPVEGLHATVQVHGLKWNELFSMTMPVTSASDTLATHLLDSGCTLRRTRAHLFCRSQIVRFDGTRRKPQFLLGSWHSYHV